MGAAPHLRRKTFHSAASSTAPLHSFFGLIYSLLKKRRAAEGNCENSLVFMRLIKGSEGSGVWIGFIGLFINNPILRNLKSGLFNGGGNEAAQPNTPLHFHSKEK